MNFSDISDTEQELNVFEELNDVQPENIDDDMTGLVVDDDDFEMGWSNQQHTQFGTSTNIIGKKKTYMNNKERYDETLRPILFERFDDWNTATYYETLIHTIPRYWFKNAVALADTFHINTKITVHDTTPEKLNETIQRYKYKTNKFDLLRYSKLIKKYL